MIKLLTNGTIRFVLFQAAWFGCVFAAAKGLTWHSAVIIWVTALLLWLPMDVRRYFKLIAVSIGFSLLGDGALFWLDLLRDQNSVSLDVAPLWLVGLWVAFAAILSNGFDWLRQKVWLSVLLGGVFGPLSYVGGVRIGALTMPEPLPAAFGVALLWMIAFPVLLWLVGKAGEVSPESTE